MPNELTTIVRYTLQNMVDSGYSPYGLSDIEIASDVMESDQDLSDYDVEEVAAVVHGINIDGGA